MDQLDQIAAHGIRYLEGPDEVHADVRGTGVSNQLTCADGFTLSVVAAPGAYCLPRPVGVNFAYRGPFRALEVGYPSEKPEPWDDWRMLQMGSGDPTEDVYGWVPLEKIRALVDLHGGLK